MFPFELLRESTFHCICRCALVLYVNITRVQLAEVLRPILLYFGAVSFFSACLMFFCSVTCSLLEYCFLNRHEFLTFEFAPLLPTLHSQELAAMDAAAPARRRALSLD